MLGQIIYNIEDYAGSGSIISTGTDGKNYTQEQFDKGVAEKVNIFKSGFFKDMGISNISKIGIQAPPGTKFVFNTYTSSGNAIQGPQIMIGRSGIYELDYNLNMDGLTFIRPQGFFLDVDKSNQLIHNGKGLMNSAKVEFDKQYAYIQKLYGSANDSASNQKFWEEYEKIHSNYIAAYNVGRSEYIQGLSGVYAKDTLQQDVRNVIIDFVYTTVSEEVN